jgi:hypothetical protein
MKLNKAKTWTLSLTRNLIDGEIFNMRMHGYFHIKISTLILMKIGIDVCFGLKRPNFKFWLDRADTFRDMAPRN